jgi:transcriptional regulator with XRE-family HTH domain
MQIKKGVAKVDGIGEIFKSKRIEMGLSLNDIENETKIRSRYLQAIEEENFEVIPGKVYLKGFIKTYAKYLNIADNEEIIRFLNENKVAAFEVEKKAALENTTPIPLQKGIPKKYLTLILSILAFLTLFLMQNLYDRFVNPPEITPPEQNQEQVEEPFPPIAEEPPETPEDEPELPNQNELIIEILDLTTAEEKCWMQIYSDNNLVYEGTMYEGEKKNFNAQEKLRLKFGNAGVVKLVLGKEELGIPGNIGQVIEKEIVLTDFQ